LAIAAAAMSAASARAKQKEQANEEAKGLARVFKEG
jgi:hypothetical protein